MTRGSDMEWPAGDFRARVLGASAHRSGLFTTLFLHAGSLLYRAGVAIRNLAYDAGLLRTRSASIPVLSVGNLVAGGAGKTPFTRWLAEELRQRGRRVAIVHGGYASDEPALHRQWHDGAPVIEDRDRVRAVQRAASEGADVVILDDAFQHRRLARDLDIVLVPAESTSHRLLPAGPLREPERGLRRADLIVVTRKTASLETASAVARRIHEAFRKTCVIAALEPARVRHASGSAESPPDRVVIVTAIARPDLLRGQVAAMNIHVQHMYAYPDHHDFTPNDVRHILHRSEGWPVLTTEKDAIKLQPLMEVPELWILEQRVRIEQGGDVLSGMIEKVL